MLLFPDPLGPMIITLQPGFTSKLRSEDKIDDKITCRGQVICLQEKRCPHAQILLSLLSEFSRLFLIDHFDTFESTLLFLIVVASV